MFINKLFRKWTVGWKCLDLYWFLICFLQINKYKYHMNHPLWYLSSLFCEWLNYTFLSFFCLVFIVTMLTNYLNKSLQFEVKFLLQIVLFLILLKRVRLKLQDMRWTQLKWFKINNSNKESYEVLVHWLVLASCPVAKFSWIFRTGKKWQLLHKAQIGSTSL